MDFLEPAGLQIQRQPLRIALRRRHHDIIDAGMLLEYAKRLRKKRGAAQIAVLLALPPHAHAAACSRDKYGDDG